MFVKFWGVRGSYPKPLSPTALREKIAAVVQRISASDLLDQDSREAFLASLPDHLFSTPGGNTPCLELRPDPRTLMVFDAGTGIIELGKRLAKEALPMQEIHLFFSHFHYDHIQGLPFFGPAYQPSVSLHLYSPEPDFEFTLKEQMKHPFFPVTMQGTMTRRMYFHQIRTDEDLLFGGGTRVRAHELRHPGRAYGYRVERDGRSLVFCPDYEIMESDFHPDKLAEEFFHSSDVLILDTMYTLGEAIEKINWGHSAFSIGVEFAHRMAAKRLFLFHHEPMNDDQQMYKILQSARWFGERMGASLSIHLAEEGKEFEL